MEGLKFGRLTVLKQDGSNKRFARMWICKCECGTEKRIEGTTLRSGSIMMGITSREIVDGQRQENKD